MGSGKGKEPEEPKFPPVGLRPLIANERVAPVISQQGPRLNTLVKNVLPVSVHLRTTRLLPPPALTQEGRKLTYGPGVSAPWNSGPQPALAGPALQNGAKKEKEKDGKDAAASKPLPDAKLYATWSWEQKSFRDPVRRGRAGTVQLSGAMGNGRRKSESHS